MNELFSLSDVAKLIVVAPHRILYLLSVDPSLEPKLRVAGKRLWTHEEIVPISDRFALQTAARLEREGRNHAR
jgi:hypothetical protein